MRAEASPRLTRSGFSYGQPTSYMRCTVRLFYRWPLRGRDYGTTRGRQSPTCISPSRRHPCSHRLRGSLRSGDMSAKRMPYQGCGAAARNIFAADRGRRMPGAKHRPFCGSVNESPTARSSLQNRRMSFHLSQNGNRHLTLYLQGLAHFHARKIGEPPRFAVVRC